MDDYKVVNDTYIPGPNDQLSFQGVQLGALSPSRRDRAVRCDPPAQWRGSCSHLASTSIPSAASTHFFMNGKLTWNGFVLIPPLADVEINLVQQFAFAATHGRIHERDRLFQVLLPLDDAGDICPMSDP
jgi:hypothetical protein